MQSCAKVGARLISLFQQAQTVCEKILGFSGISWTGQLCRASTMSKNIIPLLIVIVVILLRKQAMQIQSLFKSKKQMGGLIKLIVICLALCAILVECQSHYNCDERQWLQRTEEEQLRSDIAQRESGIFAEDQLIFKVINFVMANPTLFNNMVLQKCRFLIEFNMGYALTLTLLLTCFFVYSASRKYSKAKFPPSFDISKQTVRKAMAVLLCVVCFLAVAQALRGMDEAEKLKKSLNEVYCRVVQQPKGLIRGLNGTADIGYQGFMQYQKQAENSLLPNKHLLRSSCTNLLMAQCYLNITSAIIDHLQKNKEKSDFLTEFKQSSSHLQIILRQIISKNLRKIENQQYILEQILQTSIFEFQAIQRFLKHYNRSYADFIVNKGCFLLKTFFFLVVCISIIIASFLIYNSISSIKIQPKCNIALWAQLLIVILIFVCIICFFVNSFILTISGTLYSSIQRISTGPEQFLHQFSGLKVKEAALTILLISPFNVSMRSIDNGKYVQQFTRYVDFFAPYAERKPTYFYDMLNESLSYVKDDSFREETIALMRMKERVLKEPFATNFKTLHQIFKNYLHFLQKDGLYDQLNGGAVGEIVQSAGRTLSLLLVNRSFQYHEICGRLSILLSVVLLLMLFMNRQKIQSEQRYGKPVSLVEMQEHSLILQPMDSVNTNAASL